MKNIVYLSDVDFEVELFLDEFFFSFFFLFISDLIFWLSNSPIRITRQHSGGVIVNASLTYILLDEHIRRTNSEKNRPIILSL